MIIKVSEKSANLMRELLSVHDSATHRAHISRAIEAVNNADEFDKGGVLKTLNTVYALLYDMVYSRTKVVDLEKLFTEDAF